MVISTLTLVLLAGLLIVMLRVDVGVHRSADQLERIASALEKPASVASDAPAAAARAKLDYEEIAAAIAAARVALNAKKRGSSAATVAATAGPRPAVKTLSPDDRKKHEEN